MPINIFKKTEVTRSIRFARRQDFGLELLAYQQRRSVNSLVQWAVDRLLRDPHHGLRNLDDLWDAEESDRIVNVATKCPALLDDRWQPVWKAIQEDQSLWTKSGTPNRREIKRRWDALTTKHMGRTVGRPRIKR